MIKVLEGLRNDSLSEYFKALSNDDLYDIADAIYKDLFGRKK